MDSVLSALTWSSTSPATRSNLCCTDSEYWLHFTWLIAVDRFIYPQLLLTWSRSHNPFQPLCLLSGDPWSNYTGRYWHILLHNTIKWSSYMPRTFFILGRTYLLLGIQLAYSKADRHGKIFFKNEAISSKVCYKTIIGCVRWNLNN